MSMIFHRLFFFFAFLTFIPFFGFAIENPLPDGRKVFNIRDFGATGDGKRLDTAAINKAIEECTQAGGGVVQVPPGIYHTAVVYLKSNVTLKVQKGATLFFSGDFKLYPIIESRWAGIEMWGFTPLIYADEADNVSIIGEGTIDGNGNAWWKYIFKKDFEKIVEDGKLNKLDPRMGLPVHIPGDAPVVPRPFLIRFRRCKNVLIEGITVQNSPCWTIQAVYCENVIARGVTALGPKDVYGPNVDGINADSCTNVLIENCRFATCDDCIAIKSGRNEDGRRVGIPTENVTIRNCAFERGNGIAIGSETSGDIRNVRVDNCTIKDTTRGIRVKSMRGRGGIVENACFSNIKMSGIHQEAIDITMFYHDSPPEPVSERTPIFRDFIFSNITCDGAQRAMAIRGLPEMPIENISMENASISARKGISCTDAKGVAFNGVKITAEQGTTFAANKTNGLVLAYFTAINSAKDAPIIKLTDVCNATVRNSKCEEGTDVYLELLGKKTKNIRLLDNELSGAREAVKPGDGINDRAVLDE